MNLRKQLLKEYSKANSQLISKYIGNNEERFSELMDLFFHDTYRVNQRAAVIVLEKVESNLSLVKPYIKKMISCLKNGNVAVKRNALRILQFIDIPKNLQGVTAETCFLFLTDAQEPIAVKVFSMTVLANLSRENPELKNELRIVIEDQLLNASAGFKARAKKIIK